MVAVKWIRIRNRIWVSQVDELTIWDDDNAGKGSTLGGGTGFSVRGKMG
jgi:hypothetical protein